MAIAVTDARAAESTAAVQSPASHDGGRVAATITVLDGTVHIAGVDVELRRVDGNVTIGEDHHRWTRARPPSRMSRPAATSIRASRPGFVPTDSTPFDVRARSDRAVLLDVDLTFVADSLEVRAPISPTQSIQPVSTSDMMSGSVLEIAPLEGDDFQSLLPCCPASSGAPTGGCGRKADNPHRVRCRSAAPASSIHRQVTSISSLPGQSLESVELLANPFAAEYGRFSTSVTQIRHETGNERLARSNRATSCPASGRDSPACGGFEPRFSVRGPLQKRSTVPRAGHPVPLRQRSR